MLGDIEAIFTPASKVFSLMGTKGVRLEPACRIDSMVTNGRSTTITTRHQCITSMKQYENKSVEELRFEDMDLKKEGIFSVTSSTISGRDVSNTVFANSNSGTGQISNKPNPFGFAANNACTTPSFGHDIFTINFTPSNPSFGLRQTPEKFSTSSFFGTGCPVTSSTACGTTVSSSTSSPGEKEVFRKGRSKKIVTRLKSSSGFTGDHKQFALETQLIWNLSLCPNHPLTFSRFYCTDCFTGSCCQCLTNHKTHNWITIEEHDTNQKQALNDIQKSYEKETSEMDNLLKIIHKYNETLVIQQEQQYKNMMTSLMKCRNNLRNNTIINELTDLSNKMKDDKEKILQLISNGSKIELDKHIQPFKNQLKESRLYLEKNCFRSLDGMKYFAGEINEEMLCEMIGRVDIFPGNTENTGSDEVAIAVETANTAETTDTSRADRLFESQDEIAVASDTADTDDTTETTDTIGVGGLLENDDEISVASDTDDTADIAETTDTTGVGGLLENDDEISVASDTDDTADTAETTDTIGVGGLLESDDPDSDDY